MKVEISLEDLARLTGKTALELKSEIFDGEGEESKQRENAVQAIEAAFSRKFSAIKDENHGKGLRKAMEQVEKWVKQQSPDIDTSLQGEELLNAWAATLQKSEGGKGHKVTAEELESNDIARQWLESKVKALKEANERKISALTEQLTTAQQKALRDRVQREALAQLDSAKWIAGDDEDTRRKRTDAIFRLIEYGHIREDESGNLIVTDESGNPRKDATFNSVSFSDYVRDINPFGFHKFDPGKNSPSPDPAGSTGGKGKTGIVIRDQAHYNELKAKNNQERDPVKRMALNKELHESWMAQRPA